MCGRYASTSDPATLALELDAFDETDPAEELRPEEAGPNFNVAPTTKVLTVVARHDRGDETSPIVRRVRRMRWGLLPRFTKAAEPGVPAKGKPLFNARADTATSAPAFRDSLRHRRCLVPMDGWYEWRTGVADGKAAKVPYYMTRPDGSRLYAAGLWTAWHDKNAPGTAPILTCTILTVDAIGDLRRIHDRMPLLLAAPVWDSWLAPDQPAPESLLAEPDAEMVAALEIRPVGAAVNNVRNNAPELVERAGTGAAALW